MKASDRTVHALRRNDAYVIEAFRQGSLIIWRESGSSEADFFRPSPENILRKLAETYPSPCKKHDVPCGLHCQ